MFKQFSLKFTTLKNLTQSNSPKLTAIKHYSYIKTRNNYNLYMQRVVVSRENFKVNVKHKELTNWLIL